jgi:hypothetical protein
MLREIVEHLYSYEDHEWHLLNPFLKEKFKSVSLGDIRDALSILREDNRIQIENNEHIKLNGHSRINQQIDKENVFRDLDNVQIKAKITLKEKEKVKEYKTLLHTAHIQ